MVQRVTYRRRVSYNTRSNGIKQVRTPGGKVVVHYRQKAANAPKCADTGVQLYGIPALRPFEYKNLAGRKRTVKRAYGGVLSASAVKQRIIRAFIVQETAVVREIAKAPVAKVAKVTKKKVVAKKGSKPAAKKTKA